MMMLQAGQALVVDTDEGTRVLCRRVLEELGFVVEVCDHGTHAGAALERGNVALLLLNPDVPGVDAVELCGRCAVVTILLIDGAGAHRARRVAWPGVAGVLFKPFAAADLRHVLDESGPGNDGRQQADHQALIERLRQDLATAFDLDQVLQVTTGHLQATPSIAQGYLFLGRGQPLRLDRRVGFGKPAPHLPGLLNMVETASLVGLVLADGESRHVSATDRLLAPWERQIVAETNQSLICVPLKAGDTICGAIEVASQPGAPFGDADLQFLTAAATPVALAIGRSRLHKQLVHAEKLAGMGRLAASIAHEINNPLQAIHNSLHLLLSRPLTQEKRERYLSMAQMEVERLIAVVRQMLDFYRPTYDGMRPISIHGLLENVLVTTAQQVRERRVQVEREWSEQLPRVRGVGGHLKHVFTSLISNAITAMPDGGRLIIRTLVDGDQPGSVAPQVLIDFINTGPGISDEEARTLFEPKGADLELVISYGIIEQHGGMLSVKSDSKSTTFRVALPVPGDG